MYAKQKLSPLRPPAIFLLCLLLAIVLLCSPAPSRADSLEDGLKALALKVCVPSRKQSVRINWQESPGQLGIFSASAKNIFLAQLSACGLEITENSEAPLLNVAIQLTPSRLLLIADRSGSIDSRSARMIELPRAAFAASNEFPPALHFRKELLWQQEKPINSAVEWIDKSSQQHFLFLLSEGLFIRFRLENGSWIPVDSRELPPGRQSRLGRGSFVYGYPETQLAILLDGKECRLELSSRVSFSCKRTDVGGKVTAISSACDGTYQILSTGSGDLAQRDRITLAGPSVTRLPLSEDEIRSGSVYMPGPVLDMLGTEDAQSVAAVVKNLSTGNYEVYRLTTSCGD